MKLYCEIAQGSVSNRNIIIPVASMRQVITDLPPRTELYRSLYLYDSAIVEYVERHGTARAFTGVRYLDGLLFDVDFKESFEKTHQRARSLYVSLTEDFLVNVIPFFSGRGFHLMTSDFFGFQPSATVHMTVASTIMKHFGDMVDDIYSNPTRIVRTTRSFNPRSNLYKVRLPLQTFIAGTKDEIVALATANVQAEEEFKPSPPKHSGKIVHPTYLPQQKTVVEKELFKPSAYATCVQKMYLEGEQEGSRHTKLLRIASAWRRAGIPSDAVLVMLKQWASSLEPQEIERIVHDVFTKGYSYSCNDRVMESYCSQECMFFKNKNYVMDAGSSHSIEEKFVHFVRGPLSKQVFDLASIFPKIKKYQILPGELVVVWGDTGIGKSSVVQYICNQLSDHEILYFSLEMDEYLTFRRFMQIAHGMTKEEIYEHYRVGSDTLAKAAEHIRITTTPVHVSAIAKAAHDANARVVVIDTIDGLITDSQDESARIGEIGRSLKEQALAHGLVIIAIHHISKAAAVNAKITGTLDVHSGKGSSSLEQKADKVLILEPLSGSDATLRRFQSVKNRDEMPFLIRLKFDPSVYHFIES